MVLTATGLLIGEFPRMTILSRIARRLLPIALLPLGLLSACDIRGSSTPAPATANRNPNSLSSEKVAALVLSLTQAPLPPGATNVHGAEISFFTTVVDVRFECTSEELQAFLAASPVLRDELLVGRRVVLNSMSNHDWWQPDALTLVNCSEQSWPTKAGMVSALLMAGEGEKPGRIIVYLSMTIE